ncbi:uroporphyrin-iii c-methyltransferase [Phaffia rhodozyma]|uniref:precorrin-2 dehydrogenase n=1 Tax=Phaffia rhodozyma TaxID=264483 RepID=A0A0F7SNK0_PHARH|nr:uroporphyrin-iii c-methyltransferase [Phaffia rhodozyma]
MSVLALPSTPLTSRLASCASSSSSSSRPRFAQPTGSASLLVCFNPKDKLVVVIGSNRLAASRSFAALDADAKVLVSSPLSLSQASEEIRWRVDRQQVEFTNLEDGCGGWENALNALSNVSLVCVTDSVIDDSAPSTSPSTHRSSRSLHALREACTSLRIPLNIADHPELSDFTFPSTHRFPLDHTDPSKGLSALQVGISTNGRGCRLATRIKREVLSALPKSIGGAVENVGRLRELAKETATATRPSLIKKESGRPLIFDNIPGEDSLSAFPLNSPVPQLHEGSPAYFPPTEPDVRSIEETKRRMRWVAQVSEYWPFEYLGKMDESQMKSVLGRYASKGIEDEGFVDSTSPSGISSAGQEGALSIFANDSTINGTASSSSVAGSSSSVGGPTTNHSLSIRPGSPPPVPARKGSIHLLGSGPGHPSLLTIAAHKSLQTATLILSDKLVPSEILALIPPTTTLHIAKKFPGNAEGAQNEMMALALEGARRGERVVRLKQGDPFVYGRGGEEVLFFRKHGFESVVVPGVSSALAGPLMFNLPVTQRGVAESMVLCTGVGRKGKAVSLPGYERGRTLLVLMGVARLRSVLSVLQSPLGVSEEDGAGSRAGPAFPPYTPIAIIERASSADQRMVASTLEHILQAVETVGDQRPPAMMIIGWSCLALEGEGDMTVLDDGKEEEKDDRERVKKWLGGNRWLVREGLDPRWAGFLDG